MNRDEVTEEGTLAVTHAYGHKRDPGGVPAGSAGGRADRSTPGRVADERPATTDNPLVDQLTVVLLTFNCAHRLAPILDRLASLGLPVIAVDNASTDGTASVISARPGIELVSLEKNIGAAGRNIGARLARTPFVAFCDDDGWYEPGGLTAAVAQFDRHPRLALVNARILVKQQAYLDPISVEMAASPLPETAGIPGPVLLSFMGGACLVRVSAYLEVGGYDPEFFLGGEEETLAFKLARARWHMRYLPELVMHHYPSVANAPRLRAFGMRNTLWNAWIHRRLRSAIRYTLFILADTPKNQDWIKGVVLTLKGVPWVIRRRDPLPLDLDDALTVLERRRARRPVFTLRDPIHAIARQTSERREQNPGEAGQSAGR
jgi:GT2 family glycosyltransferase